MTTRVKVEIGIGLVVLALIAFGVVTYISEREDRIRAEVTNQLKQQEIDQRDKQTKELIQQLKDAAAQVKTPEQATKALPTVITLPQPVKQVTQEDIEKLIAAAVAKKDPKAPDLPDAPMPQKGDLYIPKEDVLPLYQRLNECKQNELLLGTCEADKRDTEAQRDAALKGLRGGSFFTRVKRNSKWLIIGGAVGAAIAKGVSH